MTGTVMRPADLSETVLTIFTCSTIDDKFSHISSHTLSGLRVPAVDNFFDLLSNALIFATSPHQTESLLNISLFETILAG
jgi:hypothetical protein